MSPNPTDDLLVRELTERADRLLPAMSLEPAAVLLASRRHRRRRAVGSASVGLLAVAAAAVAAAQLGTGPLPVTPPAAATAELTKGLVATAANDADIVDSGDGDTLSLTDGAEHHYTVRFDPVAGVVDAFEGGVAGAQGDDGWLGGFSAGADPADEGDGILQASGLAGDALLVAGYVSGPGEVRLEWSGDGPTLALDVPTFAVPGAAGRVYVMRIEGAALDGKWPTVTVVHSGKAEHRADVPLTPLKEHAAAADGTLSIEIANDVREVETDEGTAVDLGIPVAGGDPLDEGRTYSLRAGLLVDGDPGTPDVTGLWLDSLGPDGATKTVVGSGGSGGGGTVDEALTPANRNPTWMSMLSDHEACMVGVRPPALEGATFDLIIERDTGKQVVPIPTFRVPGLDADVWFVALTDPEVDIRDWPTTSIRVTDPDGTASWWSLDGIAQATP
ncbi:MAG TPA: hypothetical protein VFC48_02075 [Cellulomonas sp.]|nr:hypothetical protein [Cellulomonas sp.]